MDNFEKDRSYWNFMSLRCDIGFNKRLSEEEEIGLPALNHFTVLQPKSMKSKKDKTCITITYPFSLIPFSSLEQDFQRIGDYADLIGASLKGVMYGYEFDSQDMMLYHELDRFQPIKITFEGNVPQYVNKNYPIGDEPQYFPTITEAMTPDDVFTDDEGNDDSENEDYSINEDDIAKLNVAEGDEEKK